MQIKTEVNYANTDTQLVSSIEQKVSKLAHFFSHISESRIVLTFEHCLLAKSRTAEIKMHMPSGIIFIRESSKSFDIALDKALVALKVQLLKHNKRQKLVPSFC